MSMLLAKIILLLLLAALFGALFGWWLARRRWQDVTVEYTRWQTEWADWRRSFEARLGERPQPDLAPVLAGINAVESTVEAAVRGIKMPVPAVIDLQPVLDAVAFSRVPEPQALDLGPLLEPFLGPIGLQLSNLAASMAAIRIPEPLQPREVDFSGVLSRLTAVDERIAAIRIPDAKAPVDLKPLLQLVIDRVQQLEQAVLSIQIPLPREPLQPKEIDLSGVLSRFDALEARVGTIQIPAPKEPDFSGLLTRIASLQDKVTAIRMPELPAPKEVDLSGVLSRLHDLDRRVAAIRIPEPVAPTPPPTPPPPPPPAPPPTDLGPLQSQVHALRQAVEAIRIPAATTIDLGPLLQRLRTMEEKLERPAPVVIQAPPPPSKVRSGSRNLLVAADFGKPDDLKRIKGVAEVLEKMLHGIGVYYFWQVAEWSATDMAYVDAQLTAFKGRIARDDWTSQSLTFAAEPTAARRPDSV